MEIRNNAEGLKNLLGVNPASSSTAQSIRSGEKAQPAALTGDQATVSNLGQEVSQAATNGDVRWEKVSAIQAALTSGTYHVPSSAVANKVVDALLTNTPGTTS